VAYNRATGNQIKEPQRTKIVESLAAGISTRTIAKRYKIGLATIGAIRQAEWNRVESRKSVLAAQAEHGATLAADLINAKLEQSNVNDIPLNNLVPIYGVYVDKLTLLRGDPSLTIRHEHTHSHQVELINTLNAAIDRAEKRANAQPVSNGLQASSDAAFRQTEVLLLQDQPDIT
jgi:hypothetical protein